jgi:TAT (twin-arginine translocation) pathway signal sequence
MNKVSRRSFLHVSAGAATGAALAAAPAVSMLLPEDAAAREVAASGPAPNDTVVAFVRSADRGEVTILSGTSEVTYRDHALVKRLLRAAR